MSKQVMILANAITTDTDGPVVAVPSPSPGTDVLVHLDITATQTVVVNGRADAEAAWVQVIPSKTASELVSIAWVPELRLTTSGTAGGSTSAWIAVPGARHK